MLRVLIAIVVLASSLAGQGNLAMVDVVAAVELADPPPLADPVAVLVGPAAPVGPPPVVRPLSASSTTVRPPAVERSRVFRPPRS